MQKKFLSVPSSTALLEIKLLKALCCFGAYIKFDIRGSKMWSLKDGDANTRIQVTRKNQWCHIYLKLFSLCLSMLV